MSAARAWQEHGTRSFLILEWKAKSKCVILKLRTAMQCDPDRRMMSADCLAAVSGCRPEHQPTTRRHHLLSRQVQYERHQLIVSPSQEASDLPLPVLPSSEASTKQGYFWNTNSDLSARSVGVGDEQNRVIRSLSARDRGLTNSDSEFRHVVGISGFRNLMKRVHFLY